MKLLLSTIVLAIALFASPVQAQVADYTDFVAACAVNSVTNNIDAPVTEESLAGIVSRCQCVESHVDENLRPLYVAIITASLEGVTPEEMAESVKGNQEVIVAVDALSSQFQTGINTCGVP